MGRAAVVFCLSFSLIATVALAAETVDLSTRRNNMRACPLGQFAVGVDMNGNRLLCNTFFTPYTSAFESTDSSTIRQQTKACPTDYAVTGVSPLRNEVSCAHIGLMNIVADTTTSRSGMHACPVGRILLGIDFNSSKILCGLREDFCFGGLGQRCGPQREGLTTPFSLCLNGVCWVNAGSWDHDECCFANPNGMACTAGPMAPQDGHCGGPWDRALSRLAAGYNWTRAVSFTVPNRTGTVGHNQWCAPSGTIVHRLDASKCCSSSARSIDAIRDAAPLFNQRVPASELALGNARACN
ncbi:MAG: hypothetical protein ABI718_15165 [Acidobacteriota bacterium]